jgi:hypothetical protein
MKSFKDLFIKSEEEEKEVPVTPTPSFPIAQPNQHTSPQAVQQPLSGNPYVGEIIQVYEKGLESINMPGYDFYDFFTAVNAAGGLNEPILKMAFQMGKTMDASLSAQKLAQDAEYYLSKIKDVHQKYAEQGRSKFDSLTGQLRSERENLSSEANGIEVEIAKLKQQIQDLEGKLNQSRATLSKVDEKYKPQQDVIQLKLTANDQAMQISAQKLNAVKNAIVQYLK